MKAPTVSVCIPAYNHEAYVAEAIESVIAQSYEDWELIIVDDASPDRTAEICREFAQCHPERIRLFIAPQNQGPSATLNRALEEACGQYIAFHASDDRMKPWRLERQVEYLDSHPEIGMVTARVDYIDHNGAQIQMMSDVFARPISNLREQLLGGNFLNAVTATLRREVVEETGGFSPELLYVQDFDYWMRVLDRFEIERIEAPMVDYRVHGKNLSIFADGQPFGALYETAVVAVRASERWDPEKVFGRCSESDKVIQAVHLAECKARMARALLHMDRMCFGSPLISTGRAYGLMLEAMELAPDSTRVRESMREIYAALGDSSRAEGRRSLSLDLWRRVQAQSSNDNLKDLLPADEDNVLQSDPTADKYLKIAEQIHRLTGEDLVTVARRIVDNAKSADAGELESNRATFFCGIAAQVLSTAVVEVDGKRSYKEQNEFGAVADALQLLKMVLTDDPEHVQAKALYERYGRIDEDSRYQHWIDLHELQEIDGQIFAERMMLKWQNQPSIHIVLFLFPGEQSLLADTIDSINAQLFKNWSLTVIADTPSPDQMFDEFDVLNWAQLDEGDNPYEVANRAISTGSSDWVVFSIPGVQWRPQAFLRIGDYADIKPQWQLIYFDDDLIDQHGSRFCARFKPDFNLDLLRSMPYMGEACMIRREAFEAVGGVRAFPGSENYDLVLRVLDQFGESSIGHVADVLVHFPDSTARTFNRDVGAAALLQHFQRNGVAASVEDGLLKGSYQIVYAHAAEPLVTIVIPTKDKIEYFRPCIETLLKKTTYPNYEVIVVDNQTSDPDALNYYDILIAQHAERVRLLSYPRKFNYAAINNLAAREANGDYLVFLNNDTEIVQPEWLSRMMSHAQRPEVGVVGPRLVYPESGRVQHVGVVLGLHDIAEHPYNNLLDLQDSGYMGRTQVAQNYSAVTGACLLIEKSVYESVGGMDEERFAVSYNDIDLCLEVVNSGRKVVWTPFATLVHHGNITQASEFRDRKKSIESHERFQGERTAMLQKWLPMLANDPAYNRNLSLSFSDCRVDTHFPINWDVNFRDRPRIFGFPLPSGAGDYRVTQPFMGLSRAGLAQCEFARFPPNVSRVMSAAEMERMKPDVAVFHQTLNDQQLEALSQYDRYNTDVLKVFTIDDLISQVPEKSSAYKNIMAGYRDAKTRLRRALQHCDRFIASTQPLADLCADMIEDIRVIPICLERDSWTQLKTKRGQGKKPRVGWAGAMQHQGDQEMIIDVVKETAAEVDWIFFGMCIDEIKPYATEIHDYVPLDEYPEKLASLNLDLAVAPLELHPFNEAKSDLRLLEYGVLGWPVVCTDIYPYREAPVTRLPNKPGVWIETIRKKISDMNLLAAEGSRLKSWVLANRILEDRLDVWLDALTPAKGWGENVQRVSVRR